VGFWDRVRELIDSQNTTQDWLSAKIGKRPDTFSRWISRDTMPTAREAYLLARALNTTIESLVDGANGDKYILQWAEHHGTKWKPPPRIKPLLDIVGNFNDADLRKLIEIARICKSNETEKSPQAKIG
jgi:transcriptional regulator with XRE-family HTH domain